MRLSQRTIWLCQLVYWLYGGLFWPATVLIAQPLTLPQPELITDRQGLPQGFVPGIVQDRQGFIWMATHDGLCRYDGNQFKFFRPDPNGRSPLFFSDLRSLQLDQQGRIWIYSEHAERADMVLFDPRIERFTNMFRQLFQQLPFRQTGVHHCYPDRQNRLWLSMDQKGLVCFDLKTHQYHWFRHQASQPYSLASDHVRDILQDNQGTIWIATDAGLDQFQPSTGQFIHHRSGSSTSLSLPEGDIYSLYLRSTGEILIGSANYVTQFNPQTTQSRAYRLPVTGVHLWGMRFATDSRGRVFFAQRDRLFQFSDEQGPQLVTHLTPQTGFCSSLLIDRSDVLWVGTDGAGIRKYDLRTDGFQTALYQTNFQTDLLTKWLRIPPSQVGPFVSQDDPYMFRYTLDRQGAIWANVGSSTFYHVNLTTHQVEKVTFPLPFVQYISPFATDEQGRVWVLYKNNQPYWYNPQERQWQKSLYKIADGLTREIEQMVIDEQAFWLATRARGLFRLDRRTGEMRQYTHQPDQPTSISSNILICLSADPIDTNRLWIGTLGVGLCAFDKRTGQCRRITQQNGLPNDVIYSAIPDQRGYLWIGTNKGLCRMHRKTFQMRIYTTEDGLLANEFNRFHYLTLSAGQIIMGGVEGITAFQPAQLKDDVFQPRAELTDLSVNNQVIVPGASSTLSQPIQATEQLNLPYDQNFLKVGFAALHYNRPGKNRYRYQLEGLDPQWVETSRPEALYTALSPGRYTLLINASNTSGIWSPYVRRLAIVIHPPFWATWWAYVLYGLVVAGSIGYGVRLRLNRLQLQQAVALRQQEARQLRELDAMKSRFFTNVTHDFRTPLTLILSPMTGLIQDLAGTRHEKRLESIRRNAQQLLSLINQLLDFAKLDARALTVQETRGDISLFTEQMIQLFREEAARKSIVLSYSSNVTGEYWFDAEKLERIVSNLLGNALKFTPVGGQIGVSLQASSVIELVVSDTGVGISPEKLPFIFDRFFQQSANAVDNPQGGLSTTVADHQTGTGIGLALVKELVQLQGGQIDVQSQPGQGTTFWVSLPYRRVDEASLTTKPVGQPIERIPAYSPIGPESTDEQPHLLLVEDNPELADFIADSLPAHYRISLAANGAEGLQQALAELPDLVISDVMMPVMDGYTFCQKLKDDERTNHIPVILLTAKVAFESRMEGLGRGADDYLTKPFHVQELTLRIHNLLERQRRFQERMRQELAHPGRADVRLDSPGLDSPAEGQPQSMVTIPTDPFLQKLYAKVEEKLDDSSFSVEQLAEQLNMSRVHLHRKVKALTGLPASDLIRNYRLKRAKQFLRGGLNSSETAYRVGFDSPAYFSKCFRELYGKTPLDYTEQA